MTAGGGPRYTAGGARTALRRLPPPHRPGAMRSWRRAVIGGTLFAAGFIGARAVVRCRPPAAGTPAGGRTSPAAPSKRDGTAPREERPVTVLAAQRLNRASGVLAFSVLADSGLEHYRGRYANPAMVIPPVISAAALAVSAHGTADHRAAMHRVRHVTYIATALTGFAGMGFHAYNILKRPGGLSWINLFYGAPPGAPAAIAVAGLLGYGAERVRDASDDGGITIFGLPAGRLLAGLSSIGMLATTGEVWLLHFRGAYHNPAMFVPVTLPPLAALLVGRAAIASNGVNRRYTRLALRATALLGYAGVGFHAYGVSRQMGGWRNWSQNVLDGPPLPAPPSFTGMALAGLAALGLMDDHPDA